MSWSFQIRNGDLNLGGPGGFATVSGTNKLIQDLKHWLLEPRGSDPFHPDYGSVLDGGELSRGFNSPSMLGGLMDDEDLLHIESEIRRILNAYRSQQANRISRDMMFYGGKNTMAYGEILLSVDDVTVIPMGDTAVATIYITTADGQSINFMQPL